MSHESHYYSVKVEHILTRHFNCDRFDMCGQANADVIDGNTGFYTALIALVASVYNNLEPSVKREIDKHMDDICYMRNKSMLELIEEYGTDTLDELLEKTLAIINIR